MQKITLQHEMVTDLARGEVHEETYIKVIANILNNGLIAKIGVQEFATLMALISYVNEKGECCPTQRQLSERIGVHRKTVSKYINNLLSLKINDKPIVTRTMETKGDGVLDGIRFIYKKRYSVRVLFHVNYASVPM
ncbi:helix-turn-helix domain-containing protein [Lysinibacillus sp. FSL K6-0057]|uniref:helix-turn-helix domain-containing protein n=1 Tax=unclassified Lysinibacillus TaxID=2636778 RepID=UPI003159112C